MAPSLASETEREKQEMTVCRKKEKGEERGRRGDGREAHAEHQREN